MTSDLRRLKDVGDVDSTMTYRAENEAQLKGLTIFAQLLARSAVKAAARGILEREWIEQVLTWADRRPEQWVPGRYQTTIATLQADGPWAWPREESTA